MVKSRAVLRLATLAAFIVYCSSLPISSPIDNNDRPEIIEIIAPAAAARETLDSLNLGEPNSESSDRSKRTIGILRQLFPNLSQIIEKKIQAIVSFLIRTVGRQLLSGALGGGGGGGNSDSSGDNVSVDLPTFGDDDDDEDESDEDDDTSGDKTASSTSAPSLESRSNFDNSSESDTEVQTSNLEDTSSIEPSGMSVANDQTSSNTVDEDVVNNTIPSTEFTSTDSMSSLNLTTETSDSSLSSTLESVTMDTLATAADNNDSDNQLTGAESQQSEVRVQFTDPEGGNKDAEDAEGKSEKDQDGAASDQDGFSLDDIDSPDENRDKRFLGGDSSGGSSSGGGSGNFLFDIIRLIAGSGGTEQNDEASNTTADGDDAGKSADVSNGEGIPGPVTRLFIIANRGIANLIQDLILRLAQTSERIVNFKARLITSII